MYTCLEDCLIDLEKNGQLVRVKEEVDPYLEMAAIQLRLYEAQGPAVLFERVKGTKFRCAANIFGTIERSKFIFRETFEQVRSLITLRNNPIQALKQPFKYMGNLRAALRALPMKNPRKKNILFEEIRIEDMPQIHHWQMDGGAFITLPQVYSENVEHPGIMQANIGMYRIQLSGNDYVPNKEIGLHYQIHRGIGVHQSIANKHGVPLKVSVFIGGPPAHTLAAVMPLPEGISEATFAGLLAGRRFRYFYQDGYCLSADADFVITGEVMLQETKPEGPFGDHYGYYSLTHPFPVMRVHKVFAKQNAIFPFTVVGRPPQEDTSFGTLIHEITGNAVEQEIPGLKEVNAVDTAGVHPLLFAIGSERYTPYSDLKEPQELTIMANKILGTGQLSLAKYLFLTADKSNALSTRHEVQFLSYVLERLDFRRDIHFYTHTAIDTLDYTAGRLNHGSKVAFIAYGDKKRTLCNNIPDCFMDALHFFNQPKWIMPGIIALQCSPFTDYDNAISEMEWLNQKLSTAIQQIEGVALIVICDDSAFTAASISNFFWVTFTRSNPANDIYGVQSFTRFKHFGCEGPIIIDARVKPHHAPVLEKNEEVENRIDRLWKPGASLHGIK